MMAKDRSETTRPITAYKIVSLAFFALPGSPEETEYIYPPMIIKITEITPTIPTTVFRIIEITEGAVVLSPHPATDEPGKSHMSSSKATAGKQKSPAQNIVKAAIVTRKNLFIFILPLFGINYRHKHKIRNSGR